MWGHTADFTTFSGAPHAGTAGQYLFFEQQLWKKSSEDDQGLAMTAMVARANEHIAAVSVAWQLSLTYTGLFAGRPTDSTGFMLNHFDLSDDPAAGFTKDETAFELFHKFQVTPFLKITPDLQWIRSPSGDPTIDDAFVGGVRFDLVF